MIVHTTYLGHDLYLPAHVVNTKGMSTMMFLRQCLLSLLLCSSTYLFPTFDVGNSTDPQLWIVHTIVMYSIACTLNQGPLITDGQNSNEM